MDVWFLLSVASGLVSAVWSISVKWGLEHYHAETFAAWYSLLATVVIAVYVVSKFGVKPLSSWGVAAGLGAGAAGSLLTSAFVHAPNPGYAMALFRTQALLTAVASYFLHNAQMTLAKIVGMAVALSGVYVLVSSTRVAGQPPARKTRGAPGRPKAQSSARTISSVTEAAAGAAASAPGARAQLGWIAAALLAGLAMTGKDVATKEGLMRGGRAVLPSLLLTTSLVQTLFLFLRAWAVGGDVALAGLGGRAAPGASASVLAAGAAFALYQLLVIKACSTAPNVGFVKAIDTLGVALTAVGSHFLFGSGLDTRAIGGIALVTAGVMSMQCERVFCTDVLFG